MWEAHGCIPPTDLPTHACTHLHTCRPLSTTRKGPIRLIALLLLHQVRLVVDQEEEGEEACVVAAP